MKNNSFKVLFALCLVFSLATLAFGQKKFKVWSECASGCDSSPRIFVHFDYEEGFQIGVELYYPFGIVVSDDASQTTAEFELRQNPTKYFVKRSDETRVNSALNSILLKVYSLGEYCDERSIKGNFSEIGRFAPLAELRQNLKIGLTTSVKKKPVPTKPRNVAISENDLREQMMSDGLRNALDGCEGMSISIKQTKIDLNRDGQTEIIATVSSGCWGAQGTKTWIYQRTNGGLTALLTDADGGYMPTSTSTRGFRDITLSSGSYIDVYTRIFKYNGREYEYFISKRYQRNKRGKLILKETSN